MCSHALSTGIGVNSDTTSNETMLFVVVKVSRFTLPDSFDILSSLQNHNGYSVNNSTEFTEKLSYTNMDDNEIMVSFDVVSLFTAIPVDRTCEHIHNKLNEDTTLKHRTKLSIDDIIKLLCFTLSNSFFTYKETYKQIHGCAMGSPVSPIVANLCMEGIEELAHKQSTSPGLYPSTFADPRFRNEDSVFVTNECSSGGQEGK